MSWSTVFYALDWTKSTRSDTMFWSIFDHNSSTKSTRAVTQLCLGLIPDNLLVHNELSYKCLPICSWTRHSKALFYLFIYFIGYHIQQEINLLNYSIWLCNDYKNRSDIRQWNKSRKKNNIKIIIIKTGAKIYACLHVII